MEGCTQPIMITQPQRAKNVMYNSLRLLDFEVELD